MRKLVKAVKWTDDKKLSVQEPLIDKVEFKKYKFTNRPLPDNHKNACVFPMFSEFGCEMVGVLYCLPQLLRNRYQGRYSIVMGWHGREYLYRHLVDEFWELSEENQWLRDYCRAFHHESKNLKLIEKQAAKEWTLVPSGDITAITVYPEINQCPRCGEKITNMLDKQACLKCGRYYPKVGAFNRPTEAKKEVCWLPQPGDDAMKRAAKYLKPNSVGIIARRRKTYGRNLQSIFYERLIYMLEDMGYSVVWIGERSTTLPCPFSRIVNFSETTDANDLETTLALVSQLKFTVQFWTASTRLSGAVGTPFLLVESPDQIYGTGQEGLRLNLCTKGNRKLILSHFRNVFEDNTTGLNLVKRAIREMEHGDYQDLVGLVGNETFVKALGVYNLRRIGTT